MDISTDISTSYLDISIRIHYMEFGVINIYILAIHFLERHTGEVILELSCKDRNVLCPEWKEIIVEINIDGERKITGRISGVTTRFHRA